MATSNCEQGLAMTYAEEEPKWEWSSCKSSCRMWEHNAIPNMYHTNEEEQLMQNSIELYDVKTDKICNAFQYSLTITSGKVGYNYSDDTFTLGWITHPQNENTRATCKELCKIIRSCKTFGNSNGLPSAFIILLVQELLRGTVESVNACKIAFDFMGI